MAGTGRVGGDNGPGLDVADLVVDPLRLCGHDAGGDREPAERVIPAVNHAYDEALRQQKEQYPLQICLVDGKPLDAFGQPLDYNHQGSLVRLCCEDCLVVFRGEPMHYSKSLLQASLISNTVQGTSASGAD